MTQQQNTNKMHLQKKEIIWMSVYISMCQHNLSNSVSIQVLFLKTNFIFSVCKSLFSPHSLIFNNKWIHKYFYSSHISELLVLLLLVFPFSDVLNFHSTTFWGQILSFHKLFDNLVTLQTVCWITTFLK